MTAVAIEPVLAQLTQAGLHLSLATGGGLAVAPSSHLNAELRDLIRCSKVLLIDWLTAANAAASKTPALPDNSSKWKELAATYHAHHFSCPTCIAAGRGSGYGQRCNTGTALWTAYCA